jgi:Lon protease-like protein
MKNSSLTLPIFPIPVFLLPEGVTRLRIFEPRYLKMIKIATKAQGFVLWLNDNDSELSSIQWGSWVDVVNFAQGKDGLLEVDVKCKSLVELSSINRDEDNLHFGDVLSRPHGSHGSNNSSTNTLSQSLEEVFDKDEFLQELYNPSKALFTNASWVIARWLELLPVDLVVKNKFINEHEFKEAQSFVQSIIK